MKTLTMAAVAASALMALAAPSLGAAQPYGQPGWDHGPGPGAPGGWDIDRRIDWTQQRIEHGEADGSLDHREARRVEHELDKIRKEEHHWRKHDGGWLDDGQRQALLQRLDMLNDQIHWLRDNGERRPW